ncbi:alpha/beta hydrolase [Paucibacter sp. JuS9]|uniref:alpha/beta hydrolase n=1 Tax=Paucibacter sp. JuS9 TaxID=3228748 RepID=UPI003757A176
MRAALFIFLWVLFGGARAAEPVEQNLVLGQGEQALHGSLLLPGGAAKPLVALIISGSGPTDRDGNSLGLPGRNNSLKLLAEGLAREGIASVRYDKRGVAASAKALSAESNLRFDHYADDAAAWIELLRKDSRFGGVAVIGHSEGAALGLLAAQRGGVVAYVSLAGIGRDAATVLREQLKGKLPPDLAERSEQILQSLQRGETVADTPPMLAALYRPSVQPYLISWFKVDPSREIARLKMPVMVIQGTTDVQVSMADAELLVAAKPEAKLLRVEGMNHVLKAVSGSGAQQVPSYSDPALPLAPGLVEGLAAFLKQGKP